MKKLLFVIFVVLFFASCKKEQPCETNGTGTICIENNTTVDIQISFNGNVIGIVNAGEEVCQEWESGTINIFGIARGGVNTWNLSGIVTGKQIGRAHV